MYLSSQAASVSSDSVSAVSEKEIAFWLSNGHYYDLVQKRWTRADFGIFRQIQERIWQEASTCHPTSIRLQQKADDVMEMMSSMTLTSFSTNLSAIEGPGETRPKRSVFATGRDKGCKRQRAPGRCEVKGIKIVENKHKSRRSHIKEKIKTLPSTLALNRDFWRSVL